MRLLKDFGVRAWLATIVVLPTILVLCKLAWNGNEYAVVTLVTMSGGVIGTYFYQRRGNETEMKRKLIEGYKAMAKEHTEFAELSSQAAREVLLPKVEIDSR